MNETPTTWGITQDGLKIWKNGKTVAIIELDQLDELIFRVMRLRREQKMKDFLEGKVTGPDGI